MNLLFYFNMSTIQLKQYEIEEHLVQIITGKSIFLYKNNVYAVQFPSIETRDMARLIYLKASKKLRKRGLPTRDEMKMIIVQNNILSPEYYQEMSKIGGEIEALETARELTTSKVQKSDLNFQIQKAQKKLLSMRMKEHMLMLNTVESKADEAQIDYLVSCCTLCGEELNERYWNSYKDYQNSADSNFIIEVRGNFMALQSGLSPTIIRAIARSDDWRRRWKASKQTGADIFPGTSSDWDKNKVEICYWSDFYDSIFSYHTPPPEDIINDDDALFEWIREVNRLNQTGGSEEHAEPGTIKNRVNTPYKVRPKQK